MTPRDELRELLTTEHAVDTIATVIHQKAGGAKSCGNCRDEARAALEQIAVDAILPSLPAGGGDGVKRTHTERGFVVYGEPIDDGRGGQVTIHRSSAAGEPHAWLTILADAILTGPPRHVVGIDHGIAPVEAMAHLNEAAATRARDALDAWLRDRAAARLAADEYATELARELGVEWESPASSCLTPRDARLVLGALAALHLGNGLDLRDDDLDGAVGRLRRLAAQDADAGASSG